MDDVGGFHGSVGRKRMGFENDALKFANLDGRRLWDQRTHEMDRER